MVKYVSKYEYERDKYEYLGWIGIIKILTFGKVDLSDAIDEIMEEYVIIDN